MPMMKREELFSGKGRLYRWLRKEQLLGYESPQGDTNTGEWLKLCLELSEIP
jgi:hypothetical protein